MKVIIDLVNNIIKERKQLIQIYLFVFLIGISMILLRKYFNYYTGFSFMFKNFIIAMIPLVLSSFLVEMNKLKLKRWKSAVVGSFWLLFLPNAPYMLTDYKYIWMDMYTYVFIAYISWFVIPSFLAGLISMNDIFKMLKEKWPLKKVNLMMLSICLLTGFGVGLGSVLRFNSWDIGQQPFRLIQVTMELFLHPYIHIYTWLVSFSYGLLLFLMFKVIPVIGKEFKN